MDIDNVSVTSSEAHNKVLQIGEKADVGLFIQFFVGLNYYGIGGQKR